jgi:large-conductance mechanosensitive channel
LKGREAFYQVIIQDILNFLIHMIVISSIIKIIDKPAPSHSRGGPGRGPRESKIQQQIVIGTKVLNQ